MMMASFKIEIDEDAQRYAFTERRLRSIAMAALKAFDNHRKPHPEDERPLMDALWKECQELRDHLIEQNPR